jgi:multicomponent Na+:H+ antiporter subunit D
VIEAQFPALQVVLPLVGALLAALVRRSGPAYGVTLVVSLLMPIISWVLLYQVLDAGPISYVFGNWAPDLGIEYRIDVFNALLLVLVSTVGAVIIPFARRSVASEIEDDRVAWFYCIYLLSMCGLLGVAITGDAFNAFVFLEISSLASYILIALGRDRRALLAAYQYLIMGTIGATFYVIGVGLLYAMTGTLNLLLIAERIVEVESFRPVLAALAFIVVGISLKLALFPLHVWLPNAYAYAPSFATVFLAATATKVAIYLFVRYLFSIFGVGFVFSDLPVSAILIVLSIAAMFGASTVAVFQTDLKRMLAYSSVGQVGYITLGIALANFNGLTGGLVHILNHALMKSCLFMSVGAVVFRSGRVTIEELGGIGRQMPLTMSAFAIAGLGLIGVPGTAGFVSKWYLILGSFDQDRWWLAFLIVASSLISIVYIGRVVEAAWFREPGGAVAVAKEAPAEMLAPMWIMVIATIYFGIDTELTAGIAGTAAVLLLEGLR